MNRYNILEQLGDGAFGVVFKAEQKSSGEIVAIKRMKQRFVTWEECLQLREIISLRRLQHPNVIKLKEVVRENAELCMVFEFMEQNVYQITKNRTAQRGHSLAVFDEREVRSIITQTLLGVQAIHKGGFMHRDLKPENLLTKGDTVKIADFGLAKEIRCRPPFTEYVSTRWYRAPEIVLRSERYNSPIDIWALGVIMAELFLNRPLFPGASDSDQLFKICSVLGAPTPSEWDEGHQLARRLNLRFPNISPTPLRQLLANTGASAAALDLLENMLKFNPSDRPTAKQCLEHPFITGGGGGSGDGGGSANSFLFMGISSGHPHNPFHLAIGFPTPSGGGGGGGGAGTSTNPVFGGVPNSSGSSVPPPPWRANSPSPGGSPPPPGGSNAMGLLGPQRFNGTAAAGSGYSHSAALMAASTGSGPPYATAPVVPSSPYATGAQQGYSSSVGTGPYGNTAFTGTGVSRASHVVGGFYGSGAAAPNQGYTLRGGVQQQQQQQQQGLNSNSVFASQASSVGMGATGGGGHFSSSNAASAAEQQQYQHARSGSGSGMHHFGSAGPLDEY